ncbi:Imm64 family immunity protein [Paenibacillus chitinolyticus]|uniref:Imm64 family immunity protein n=1 Tax=Paenibacillus chitinolyticus TaxID=79263 RepID=UPI0035DA07D4
MGSYINVGLVFDKLCTDKLKKIIKYLINKNGVLKFGDYSKDKEGDEWVNINFNDKTYVSELCSNYYGKLIIVPDIKEPLNSANVILEIIKKENVQGVILSFHEEDVLKSYNEIELITVTDAFIHIIEDLYELVEFDYAVCDNDAEIIYTKELIHNFKKEYSITFIPDESKKLHEFRTDWHINGLTQR